MADPRGAGVSLAVDAGGDAGSAEAVVDVDDGDVGGAGIEHAEERGYAAEARAVADAGWHGNHRRGDETANDAGKGAFHSRNANDDTGLRELAFAVLEQAMNPGDTDVVELIDTVAHHVRREKRFFRDGNVAGARRDNEDHAFSGGFAAAFDGDDAGERVESGCTGGFAVGFFYGAENFRAGAGDENVVARVFFLKHGPNDFGDLLRGLSFGKHDFGKTLAQGAVMIDFGKAEILKRQVPEPLEGRAGREFPALDGFQNFQ